MVSFNLEEGGGGREINIIGKLTSNVYLTWYINPHVHAICLGQENQFVNDYFMAIQYSGFKNISWSFSVNYS